MAAFAYAFLVKVFNKRPNYQLSYVSIHKPRCIDSAGLMAVLDTAKSSLRT